MGQPGAAGPRSRNTVSALHDALLHPANRPRALCEWLAAQVNPGADLQGLQEAGGVICDFRPDFPDQDPSLSVSVGSTGTVFHRHGGEHIGGAVNFVASCLHVGTGEATRLLIERAGLVDTGQGARPARPAPRVTPCLSEAARQGRPVQAARSGRPGGQAERLARADRRRGRPGSGGAGPARPDAWPLHLAC